jgi:protein-tyrosine phosphatase
MFGLRKERPVQRGRRLGSDLHAHLVPGVDDGVRTIEEAVECIRGLAALGYDGCVVTPHIYNDLYPNTRESLEQAFQNLSRELAAREVTFRLQLAAEYFGDNHFIDLAESAPLLSFPENGHSNVLIEFPYIGEPLYWADVLSAAVRRGCRPVIAHPERYRYLAADLETWLERFSSFGVTYQCDLGSLVGQYGHSAARTVRAMSDRRLVKYWGTDLHRPSQLDRFIRPAIDQVNDREQLNPL